MSHSNQSIAPDGQPWRMTVLRNANGMDVTFMDWGATWLSARVPLPDGSVREAVLGCASPADYLNQSSYLGACIGRYANRINQAHLIRTGHQLAANQPPHQLHGGPEGFNHRRWLIVSQAPDEVTYRLHSPDGDQGFPGNLTVQVRYQLTDDNSLLISYEAETDQLCPVVLTNHAYFNLDANQGDARQHRLQITADRYLPVATDGIPDNDLQPVAGNGFDFRQEKQIADDFLTDADQKKVRGYDHAFLLNQRDPDSVPAACLTSEDGKLSVVVYTDAPALQFYTGNYLAGTPARQGEYEDYQGIALESGFLPDSPNHPEWPQPDCWLEPGEKIHTTTRYRFTVR
ncbi:galactose-1-epimerase [Tatumella citrea]|uniref:Aldose 1-epimerase n=1 Tax=Tatumella citrea TaxID=53336 RepID=A0A1Y0LH88_TATCI|nr:galactose-1-epimerase [Tatumella citrea]ARU93433.1 galactose-1-epimerase [Tatumella citrea]ARU97472.1 galactose-1-epimerase [Tatumella citrea]